MITKVAPSRSTVPATAIPALLASNEQMVRSDITCSFCGVLAVQIGTRHRGGLGGARLQSWAEPLPDLLVKPAAVGTLHAENEEPVVRVDHRLQMLQPCVRGRVRFHEPL